MTVMEQHPIAEQTKEFLGKWGLKQKFVAKTCNIPEPSFSQFVNGSLALSEKQLGRVMAYTSDYIRRNS